MIFLITTLLLAIALGVTWVYIGKLKAPVPPLPPMPEQPASVSPLLLHYQLNLPGRGELFPALASGAPADYWPVAVLTISNASDRPVVQTVSAELSGWSERQVQTITIGAHSDAKVELSPLLLPRAYENEEIQRLALLISVASPDIGETYTQTRPVYLHAASDIYWGKKFANAQYVARWVTPHDPSILNLVSDAKKWMPSGRMPGYNNPSGEQKVVARQVTAQAEAVFKALQRSGISYVSSIFTFGNHVNEAQRIRLPRETLALQNANCMDVSAVFASAMENLDMEPVIVIVPGHAFTGVRLGPQSPEILYLDLTVLPSGSFQRARMRAAYWLKKTSDAQTLTVDVAAARALGIYPM